MVFVRWLAELLLMCQDKKKVKQHATLVDYQLSRRRRKHSYLYGTKILPSNVLIECITTVWGFSQTQAEVHKEKDNSLHGFTQDCFLQR